MFEIKGFDKLARDLEEARKAIANLDGDIGGVRFDPNDPASIEVAIQQSAAMLDERLGEYASNPIVGPLIDQTKKVFRDRIVERAAAARLESD